MGSTRQVKDNPFKSHQCAPGTPLVLRRNPPRLQPKPNIGAAVQETITTRLGTSPSPAEIDPHQVQPDTTTQAEPKVPANESGVPGELARSQHPREEPLNGEGHHGDRAFGLAHSVNKNDPRHNNAVGAKNDKYESAEDTTKIGCNPHQNTSGAASVPEGFIHVAFSSTSSKYECSHARILHTREVCAILGLIELSQGHELICHCKHCMHPQRFSACELAQLIASSPAEQYILGHIGFRGI